MMLKYDPEADALYVRLADAAIAYTDDVSLGHQYERGIDYAEDDTPVGVEILNVSRGVDLKGLPRADEIAAALERVRGIRVLV